MILFEQLLRRLEGRYPGAFSDDQITAMMVAGGDDKQ